MQILDLRINRGNKIQRWLNKDIDSWTLCNIIENDIGVRIE